MAGLRLEIEQIQDGGWMLSAKKPGPGLSSVDEDDKGENSRETEEASS
jgi:hypothetical protein